MGGRWGGDIKGRRRADRHGRVWTPPRPPKPIVPLEARARAGALLAAAGAYILVVAGALLGFA
jgi:hypothetical protein